jgi:peptidyl-prolyl cis-trans isomerase B (cyclophilin B)
MRKAAPTKFIALLSATVGLTLFAVSGSTTGASADPTNPDFVPPEITLPYATQARPAAAAPQGAVPGQPAPGQQVPGQISNGGQGSLGFQVPGQMQNMVNQAGQQMTTPGIAGQGMNPFLMKGADRLRQPPGTQIPSRGSTPPPGGYQYPGAPQADPSIQQANQAAAQQGLPQGQAGQQQAQLSTQANIADPATASNPTAVIATNKGNITIMLFREQAPQTVAAFLSMIHEGFYNNRTWHRVVPGFVIQGGCPKGDGTGNYIPPGSNRERFLPLETSPKVSHNGPGVLAMAHQAGNVNSNSCQFYITLAPQPRLDGQYTIFGGVTSGLDVVKSIAVGDKIISITPSE